MLQPIRAPTPTRASHFSGWCVCTLLICTAHLCTACAASKPASPALPPPALAADINTIGASVQGRPIECITIGEGSTVIMLMATIHGDEPAGTPLLQRLAHDAVLSAQWMRDRRLIIISLANPDGFAMHRRGNARGVDLNRNFPASSFTSRRRHGDQPLSEPESLALHNAIMQHRPERIISFHQPLACIDYDGNAGELANAMSSALAPEHRLAVKRLGGYPGSLGSFAGEDMDIPIITIELPGAASRLSDEALWQRYGPMVIASIEFPG